MDQPLLVSSALALLLSCALALALTPAVRALALRLGAVDHAVSTRKQHGRTVPRLGGLAIALGAGLSLAAALAAFPALRRALAADGWRALSLLAGSLSVAALGALDDLRGARIRHKLAVQLAAALIAWWGGFRIESVPIPFGAPLDLGALGLPITVLWMVGVTNALNLADGLDGLAAGQALIALLAFLALALARADALVALTAAAAAGGALGFLRHNLHPATIFMGDTGSLLLGFLLATLSVGLAAGATSGAGMLAPALVIALPAADAGIAFLRRLLRGFPVGRGDRGHLHHRVLDRVGSHAEAVRMLWAAALVLALASLSLAFATGPSAALILGALAVTGLLLLRVLGYLPFERRRELLRERRRNLELRAGVRQAAVRLRAATGPEEVWDVIREAGTRVLGARTVRLRLPSGLGTALFTTPGDPAPFLARFSLLGDRPGDAELELGWDDGRTGLHRDTEVAVELLCDQVLGVLGRVAARPRRRARARPAPIGSEAGDGQGAG
jgi:UDP-GlcNAc:undecaprenyl-phosphate GlcNAc-1-phosphate transferase